MPQKARKDQSMRTTIEKPPEWSTMLQNPEQANKKQNTSRRGPKDGE